MNEVVNRKLEIEEWSRVRENIEKVNKVEEKLKLYGKYENLRVTFFEDEICDNIDDIYNIGRGEDIDKLKSLTLIAEAGSASLALKKHILDRPKLLDITYDNLDVGVQTNDYIAGTHADKSLHWTSSMVVEDVVDGKEIDDKDVQKNIFEIPFEERVSVTKEETEHLLCDYTEYIKRLIGANWPEVLPNMKIEEKNSTSIQSGICFWS